MSHLCKKTHDNTFHTKTKRADGRTDKIKLHTITIIDA